MWEHHVVDWDWGSPLHVDGRTVFGFFAYTLRYLQINTCMCIPVGIIEREIFLARKIFKIPVILTYADRHLWFGSCWPHQLFVSQPFDTAVGRFDTAVVARWGAVWPGFSRVWGGIKRCKCVVSLRDFPCNSALLRLVIYIMTLVSPRRTKSLAMFLCPKIRVGLQQYDVLLYLRVEKGSLNCKKYFPKKKENWIRFCKWSTNFLLSSFEQ